MASRRRFPVSAYDQINLTSLIDTLFFLLIIFMITAPLLEYSVDVTPPEMTADPIKPDSDAKIVNIREDGVIIFDRKEVTMDQLQMILARIQQESGKETALYLRGDKNLKYGVVMGVMRLMRGAGFRNINLVMQEEPKP